MADHKWQKSMMNHGLAQCCKCFITINEAAALGIMHECDAQQEPAPMFEPMTRERLETIFETFKRDALLAGMAPADWDKTIDKVKALAIEALAMREGGFRCVAWETHHIDGEPAWIAATLDHDILAHGETAQEARERLALAIALDDQGRKTGPSPICQTFTIPISALPKVTP